jgi:hypothetical protein
LPTLRFKKLLNLEPMLQRRDLTGKPFANPLPIHVQQFSELVLSFVMCKSPLPKGLDEFVGFVI